MTTATNNKRIVIIAGPNGAGKTTFAREFLPMDAELPNFVNADLIAAGLSPFAPELAAFKAGRLMLETIAEYTKRGERFSFEPGRVGTSSVPTLMSTAWAAKILSAHPTRACKINEVRPD